MNILIVAGEVSGDHHAAPVITAIKKNRPDIEFWGLGGDHMASAGCEVLQHVKDLSVTGFVEVIKHLSFFRSVMAELVEESFQRQPVAALLIDYPGFNLRLGLRLKAKGIPVYYYISPQVWAWKKGRVKTMRRFIRHMFVIFPFEESFYSEHDIPVSFVGHPIVEKDFILPDKDAFFDSVGLDKNHEMIAILPGSRRNELERLVPPLAASIRQLRQKHPELQFCVASLSSLDASLYDVLSKIPGVHLVQDDPYSVSLHADAAIVASGTASLETAYLGTPLIVVYKISYFSYLIGKMLIHVDYLAMPNLILGERAVPELIQGQVRPRFIVPQVELILSDSTHRSALTAKLERLRGLLGNPGCASRVSAEILKDLPGA